MRNFYEKRYIIQVKSGRNWEDHAYVKEEDADYIYALLIREENKKYKPGQIRLIKRETTVLNQSIV